MRQLLDYYFILEASTVAEREKAREVIADIGLTKFAEGIMYIENKVFALDASYMVCEQNAEEGEFLLEDIERGGNFGRYDERNVVLSVEKHFTRGWYNIQHNVRYQWTPTGSSRHYLLETLALQLEEEEGLFVTFGTITMTKTFK